MAGVAKVLHSVDGHVSVWISDVPLYICISDDSMLLSIIIVVHVRLMLCDPLKIIIQMLISVLNSRAQRPAMDIIL